MKKIFLTMACACCCCTASLAQFGQCTPSERWTYTCLLYTSDAADEL